MLSRFVPPRLMPPYFMPSRAPIPKREPNIESDITPRRLLFRTMFAYPGLIAIASSLMVISRVAEILVPVVIGKTIDGPISNGNSTQFWWWLAALAVVFACQILSHVWSSRIGYLSANYAQHSLRMSVTDKVLDPAGMSGKARLPGELLSIAANDAEAATMVKILATYPVGDLVAIMVGAVLLTNISWILGLLVFVGAPLVVLIAERSSRPLRHRSRKRQETVAAAAGTAADLVSAARVVKGLRAETEASRRYDNSSQRALQATVSANWARAFLDFWVYLSGGLYLLVVSLTAAFMTLQGKITVGELIIVVSLSQMIIQPMTAMGAFSMAIWASAYASAKRILSILRTPALLKVRHGKSLYLSTGDVPELALNLPEEKLVIPAGTTVALRLAADQSDQLVSRLALQGIPEPGSISLGGFDLSDLDPEDVRRSLLVSPHNAELFTGTLWENVALNAGAAAGDGADAGDGVDDGAGAGDAADDGVRSKHRAWVETCLDVAGCNDIVQALPEGVQTQVGEAGLRLSGGQRQRVALARALVKDADVLVLNNPVTAVDSATVAHIAQGLFGLRAGKTTVIISDTPVWFAQADIARDYSMSGVVNNGGE